MLTTDYRIVHEKQGWIAATGFHDMEKAIQWIRRFDPQMYTDTTLRREDFVIQGLAEDYNWRTCARFNKEFHEN
jgi:hypothetical protein